MARIEQGVVQRDTTSKITDSLLTHNVNIRVKDVKNKIQKLQQRELGGRTPIEAPIQLLNSYTKDDQHYFIKVDYSSKSRVRNIFFIHPVSFELIKANPDVFQIDATYKTNKLRMPLLHIVGVNCRGHNFDVGYGFMGGVREQQYMWHISAFKELLEKLGVAPKCFVTDTESSLKLALTNCYPNVAQHLCIWHINQNVQAQAVQAWDIRKAETDDEVKEREEARATFMQHWHEIVNIETEEEFHTAWSKYKNEYYYTRPGLFIYPEYQWLPLYKEWAYCFTRYMPNYGIKVTSRAEGAHHHLKNKLHFSSQSHLLYIIKAIHAFLKGQYNKYKAGVQECSVGVPTDAQNPNFALLHRRISYKALRKLKSNLTWPAQRIIVRLLGT